MPKPSDIPAIEERYGKPIREVIIDALNRSGGNVTKAAVDLGVPLGTLAHWMNRYGVKRQFVPISV